MTSMLTEYYNQIGLSKDSLASTSSYLGGANLFSNLQKSMRPIVDQKLTTSIQGLSYLYLAFWVLKQNISFFRFTFLWIS